MKILSLIALILLALPAVSFAKPTVVTLEKPTRLPPGSIVIEMKQRALYYLLDGRRAIRYPVAVPKKGMEWSGYARVNGVHHRPAWSPPAVVKRDNPNMPDYFPGGHPQNPMGEAAITLDRDELAIHGTSRSTRGSIGTAASYGCVRMLNEDVLDLAARVGYGTLVLMKR